MLLIGFSVAGVFVHHVRGSGFNLALHNFPPKLAGFDGLSAPAFGLVFQVKSVELVSPHVGEPGTLVRTHQGPVFIIDHALHEDIIDPQG